MASLQNCQDREKKARFLVTAFKIKRCLYDHNKKKKKGPGIDRFLFDCVLHRGIRTSEIRNDMVDLFLFCL